MGCSECSNCPPCQTDLPITCEPLTQAPNIARLVGEDEAGCKVTLINNADGGFLFLTGDGEIQFRNGANNVEQRIAISALRQSDSIFEDILVGDSTLFSRSRPTYAGASQRYHLVAQNDVMSWIEDKLMFGAGSGILRKDINSPYGLSWLTGNAGQVATVDTDGNVAFKDVSTIIPSNAFADRLGYYAIRTGTKTIDVNFKSFIVADSGVTNFLGVTNSSVKTLTLTTNGANGLDTGSLAATTIYYVFLIYNQTSGSSAMLASTSGTAPAMPTGYTYKRFVGMFRTDASSNVAEGYNQVGNLMRFGTAGSYATFQKTGGATNGFASGAIASYISTDFVSEAIFQINQINVSSSGELNVFIASAAGQNLDPFTTQFYGGSAVTSSQNNKHYGNTFNALIPVGSASYYNIFYSGMSAGSDSIAVSHIGYVLNV